MTGFRRASLTVAQRVSTFDPAAYMAARTMSMYLVGADWSASTPTVWLGRASAGTSGNGKQFRRDRYSPDTGYQASAVDPSATTVGGKQWVLADPTNGSPMVLRNAGNSAAIPWFNSEAWGPADWTMTAAVRFDVLNRNGTNGGTIAGAVGADGTLQPGVQANGSVHLWQRSATSTDQAVTSASGLITASEVCIIQSQYQETTGILRFRKNKGAWSTYSGTATDRSGGTLGSYAAVMNSLVSTTTFRGALGLFAVEQSFVTSPDIDTIADACAAIAGVTI